MEWLAFIMALTCADGSCDQEDWGTMPPAAEAVDADECHADDPACADLATHDEVWQEWSPATPWGLCEPGNYWATDNAGRCR